ncbi:UNVERIFIED_CONTAM: hypothetical protein PYX00_008295 [Menopon gallinae]|uniref:Uncharacterized protein n=1 Tax=Menopon gallinae TaxID=328185 RepID=A0AAW2HME3_9NEOP
MKMKRWTDQLGSNTDFEVYVLVFATLFLQTSSSSSNENVAAYVRLNNITLPLTSFIREYCSKEPCLDYQWCNDSVPSFYCGRTDSSRPTCMQWCVGEKGECSEIQECCGSEFECIHKICKSTNLRIDLVVVVKVALATALIITIFAVFTLCWKGFIEPRCINYTPRYGEDTASVNSERFLTVSRSRGCNHPPEKPPPYEECVQGNNSHEDPPPYSVAVNVTQTAIESPPDGTYVLACTSDPAELNVQNIKLQESSIENVSEVMISSPVNNMEDFVCFSTPVACHTEQCHECRTASNPGNSESKPDECTVVM